MNAGLPTRVFSGGGKFAYPDDAMETPDTLMATYAYDDFNIIWDHACGINHGLYNRKEGLAFYGENGTMVLDRAGWEVIPVVSNNVARMLSCIKSRELPNADVAIGARVAKMAHLANISCRVQREVHWDDKNNLFVGDNEATALSKAYYRAPWELPKL